MHTFSTVHYSSKIPEHCQCIILFIDHTNNIVSDHTLLTRFDSADILEQITSLKIESWETLCLFCKQSNIAFLCVNLDAQCKTAKDYQTVGAKLFKKIKAHTFESAAFCWPNVNETQFNVDDFMMIMKGFLNASYTFNRYKSEQADNKHVDIQHCCADINQFKVAYENLSAITDGTFLAKDLMNEPANILTPIEFCNRIKDLDNLGLEIEILDEAKCRKEKMFALLSVGQGSAQPSRLACVKWHGSKKKSDQPVALIGKGVCFDSGGINLKRAMLTEMKFDMGGAAAVIGAMVSIAKQKIPVNVIGIVALTENMTGSQAYRPSDIISSRAGKSIEVLNTDAEGRLILADAMDYATDFKPRAMIDVATLTGAIIVALGHEYAGVFCNESDLSKKLNHASDRSGEKVWQLPLDKEFDKLIDSPIADCQNISTTGGAGSITAAQFLQRFAKDIPWAHIDIAGTAWNAAPEVHGKGPSGYGVNLLTELVKEYVEE